MVDKELFGRGPAEWWEADEGIGGGVRRRGWRLDWYLIFLLLKSEYIIIQIIILQNNHSNEKQFKIPPISIPLLTSRETYFGRVSCNQCQVDHLVHWSILAYDCSLPEHPLPQSNCPVQDWIRLHPIHWAQKLGRSLVSAPLRNNGANCLPRI